MTYSEAMDLAYRLLVEQEYEIPGLQILDRGQVAPEYIYRRKGNIYIRASSCGNRATKVMERCESGRLGGWRVTTYSDFVGEYTGRILHVDYGPDWPRGSALWARWHGAARDGVRFLGDAIARADDLGWSARCIRRGVKCSDSLPNLFRRPFSSFVCDSLIAASKGRKS